MFTAQDFLYDLLSAVRLTKYILQTASDEASAYAMRSSLLSQLQEFDMIETEILAIAGRRGWDFPELEPSGKYVCRFRLTHRVRRTDSDLSERIILQLTKDMIYILKLLHQINAPDTSIQYSTQKYLDRNAISIRQLQAFL